MRISPKKFSTLFVENRLKITPTQSETSLRMYPNQFEVGLICIGSDTNFKMTRNRFGLVQNSFLSETLDRVAALLKVSDKSDWNLFRETLGVPNQFEVCV